MTRRALVTPVQRWRRKVAAEQHERDRRDPGTLEPCPYCTPTGRELPHEPGRCPSGMDRA